jgi:hypothetical protein
MVTSILAADNLIMLRLATITLLAVITSACSRTELAYRNADRLLEYYASQTVSISASQRDQWQPLLHSTLQRHREQELPLVIAWLDLTERIIRETDGTPGAACLVEGALLLFKRHAQLAVDLSVPLLAELDATQIRHPAEYTTQRQQDAVKHYLDSNPEKRKTSRQQRYIDRVEYWTGNLTESQRKQVRDALERIPDLSVAWLSHRAQQTDTLVTMLETGATAEELRKFLDAWWVQREEASAETSRLWYIARNEFVQLMDGLAATLTRKQRATIENQLGDLRADLAAFLPDGELPADLQTVSACAGETV